MRIAFYAPLKPPTHPVPSGDRLVARLLMQALREAGHTVTLASVLRTRDGNGDAAYQERLRATGARMAARLVRRYRALPAQQRPQAWFTYHLYHKAPDWLGPPVADALGIPYLVAEASVAGKQAEGPWRIGHDAAKRALGRADAVFSLNAADEAGIRPFVTGPARLHLLPPFLDPAPFVAAREERDRHRANLARRHALDPAQPWLAVAAMMRPGDKLNSYRLLAQALDGLQDRPWRLMVAGDGPARAQVEQTLSVLGDRVRFLGRLDESALPGFFAAADLYVWPALREAFGMAFLEAQAASCPVVAGAEGGVPGIVRDGESGILTPPGDGAAFAAAVACLLDDAVLRARMGENAAHRIAAGHSVAGAARLLDTVLRQVAA